MYERDQTALRVADMKQALEEAKLLYHISNDLQSLVRDFEFVIAAYEQERQLRLYAEQFRCRCDNYDNL